MCDLETRPGNYLEGMGLGQRWAGDIGREVYVSMPFSFFVVLLTTFSGSRAARRMVGSDRYYW